MELTIAVIVTFTLTTLFNILMMRIITNIMIKAANKEHISNNPVNVIRKANEQFEIQKEQEKNKIISENIDNYNGTSLGQREIPR